MLVGIAVTLPILLGLQFGHFEIGLALCIGAFWSSPSDVTGSFRHKKIGILSSAALVTVVGFIGGYLHYETWLSLPVLGILSFGIAFISIYGFRASLISFSGLLALALSFAHDSEELEIYQYALLVGVGGLWYLLLAKVWYRINPKAETEELLSKTYSLTAEFINTRGELIEPHEGRERLLSKLLKLQSELTENHESLREILIVSKKKSGWSSYEDQRLLVFVQLVEMMEAAIANPVNYETMDVLFNDHPQYIKLFQRLIFKMSHQLRLVSEAGNDKTKLPKHDELRQCFEDVRLEIASLRETENSDFVIFQNWFEYQEKQLKKLKRINWLLGDPNPMEMDVIDRKAAKRFVAAQDYDPQLLVRNFNFRASIFRHSLRLAVTVMVGYALGSLLPFQNPYWILLTIIVIMRPSYGLTKNRAKDRLIGTLIGGAIAYALVFLIQDLYVYGALGVASLVIALALIQKNARAAAIFITLSVVFVYAIISPDVLTVIKFRILDTLVGAGLSIVAILWLWPTWESVEIKESIKKSVKTNKEFLREISEFYQKKGKIPVSYGLARKEAFLETSNLNSAFQRMAQEPKSKQIEMDKNYEMVVLNHTFLASLASLSTYIQQHKTTEASKPFKITTEIIGRNLELTLNCLSNNRCDATKAIKESEARFDEQVALFDSKENWNLTSNDQQTYRDLQEAQLVVEQLQWLFSISCKMLKLTAPVNRE